MISFKEYLKEQLLLEWDREKTLVNYSEKLSLSIKKDRTAKNFTPDSLIDKFAELDPTNNKIYVNWLIKQFIAGIKYEDISSKGKDWLDKFNQIKSSNKYQDEKDINKISFRQLGDIYLKYQDTRSTRQTKISNKLEGATKEFENSLATVIVPHTEAASCLYGSGTKWCTAAKSNNRFDEYNEEGPLYIIIPKNPSYTKEKYQFHFASDMFMDANDDTIEFPRETLDKFKLFDFFQEKYPNIKSSIIFQTKEDLQEKINVLKVKVNDYLKRYQENLLDDFNFQEYLETEIGLEQDEIDDLSHNDLVKHYNDFDDGFNIFEREVMHIINTIDIASLYRLAIKESILGMRKFYYLISEYLYNELKSWNYESGFVYDLQDALKEM